MPQTALETALANAYPQDLEKLAVDLLSERGYEVEPTGIKATRADAFEPTTLKPLLDRFWYEAGRSNGSPHFSNS
jgi:hypothetical protein